MRISVPKILTGARIVMIPVLAIVFYLPYDSRYLLGAAVFSLAAITDWLDGYLARKLGQVTPFGAFLDPVADKLLVAVALVLLVEEHASAVLAVPALVIVGREIVVSALREWMAQYSERRSLAVSYVGKVKTTFQMTAIIVLLANPPDLRDPIVLGGYGLLFAAAALTLWSMYGYLKLAWPDLASGMERRG
mgnify:FL=1